MRILIRGARRLDPAAGLDDVVDLLIDEGVVAACAPCGSLGRESADRTVVGQGLWVTPGLLDMHVHLREPGDEEAENIESGCRAAVAGGFATVVAMANTDPVNDTPQMTTWIRARAEEVGLARVLPIAAVTEGMRGERLAPLASLKDAGACAFSDDGRPIERAELMREALCATKTLGVPIVSHAEDVRLAPNGVMNAGRVARRLGVSGIPAEAEVAMVARDIELAAASGGHLHIAHVSTGGAMELIRQAKRSGIDVTAEVTPHHFTLTEEAVAEYGAMAKMRPPLREEEDVEVLRQALADGTVDAIASDHAPHTAQAKGRGLTEAPFGVIGLETTVPLTLALVRAGSISPLRAVELLTTGPARAMRRPPPTLAPGAEATLTIIDPERRWRFLAREAASRSQNSPFDGWRMVGRAVGVILSGRPLMLPLGEETS